MGLRHYLRQLIHLLVNYLNPGDFESLALLNNAILHELYLAYIKYADEEIKL